MSHTLSRSLVKASQPTVLACRAATFILCQRFAQTSTATPNISIINHKNGGIAVDIRFQDEGKHEFTLSNSLTSRRVDEIARRERLASHAVP
eukprot:Awhi_evm1s9472